MAFTPQAESLVRDAVRQARNTPFGRPVLQHIHKSNNTAGIAFSGTAYVAGIKTTGLNSDDTKPWVKCNLGTGACSQEFGPPANPFPYNEEWFEKANTYGDIHVPRAG